MEKFKSLANQPISLQARHLAEEVFRVTFEPTLRGQSSISQRMRQLAVEIATDLSDAREHDRLQIKSRCNAAQENIAALRRECHVNDVLGHEGSLKNVADKCDKLDRSVDQFTTLLDSQPGPETRSGRPA